MQLIINGEEKNIEGVRTLAELLKTLGYERNSVAVARESEFVPRQSYDTLELQDGQALEILLPMQGG